MSRLSSSGAPSQAKMMALRSQEQLESRGQAPCDAARVISLRKADGSIGLTAMNNPRTIDDEPNPAYIDGHPSVIVIALVSDGIGAKAGVGPGDVITHVNGEECPTHQQCVRLINEADGTVEFKIAPRRADMVRLVPPAAWVFKRNDRRVWQQRWLVCWRRARSAGGAGLYYYSQPESVEANGHIPMGSIVAVRNGGVLPPDISSKQEVAVAEPEMCFESARARVPAPSAWTKRERSRGSFEVEVKNGRVYTFSAANADMAADWVNALTKLRFGDVEEQFPAAAAAASPRAADSPQTPSRAQAQAAYQASSGYQAAVYAHVRRGSLERANVALDRAALHATGSTS